MRFVTDADDTTDEDNTNSGSQDPSTSEAKRATTNGAFGTMGISLGFVQVSCAQN